jgi:hypothetical protein
MQGLTMAIQMENPHKELGFIPHNTVTAALEQAFHSSGTNQCSVHILQEHIKITKIHNSFMTESELELHFLSVTKSITVASYRLVHGRGSTPQNLETQIVTQATVQQFCLNLSHPKKLYLNDVALWHSYSFCNLQEIKYPIP